MTEVDVFRYVTIRDGEHSLAVHHTGPSTMQEWLAMSLALRVGDYPT